MGYLEKNPPAKRSAALAVCVAIVLAGIAGAAARPASAADDDYMYCYTADRDEKITYFSAIFRGDYFFDSTRAQLDFHSHLKGTGENPNFLGTHCFFENTYREAELELQYEALQKQRYPYADWTVVHTNWKPGISGPPPTGDSDDSHGRESGGDGCYFGECPDDMNPPAQPPDNPSRETSRRTVICSTPEGWCEMSAELPIGQPCGCFGSSGPIGGITVRSVP